MPVITRTHLVTAGSSTNASSYETASISPTGNRLVLAWVFSKASTLANTPTLSGNGITWVQVATQAFDKVATPDARITLFRGMVASPSAGAVTIDFGGQNQDRSVWSITEFDVVDTGGTNGSVAVVQSAINAADLVTSLTMTLAAFGHPDNACAGGFAIDDNVSLTAGTGFAILGQATTGVENGAMMTEWRNDNDTTVDASSQTQDFGGIAVEIKAAPASVTIDVPTAAIIITGFVPTVTGDLKIDVPTAALTITGLVPNVAIGTLPALNDSDGLQTLSGGLQ